MKLRYLLTLALVVGLSACGGGGGGATSVTPTTAPAGISYTAHIVFVGGDASAQTFAAALHRHIAAPQASGAEVIMMTAPALNYAQFQGNWISGSCCGGDDTGYASVSVSPQPSVSPSPPTWTSQDADVSFSKSSDVSTAVAPSPQVVAIAIRHASSGTLTAVQPVPSGTPVATTSNVVVYDRLSIACTTVDPSVYGASSVEAQGGTQMVSGVATPTSDVTKADLYLSGPNCFGAYRNSTESLINVNCPYGCQYFTDKTQFLTATAAMLTSSVVIFPSVTIPTDLNDLDGFLIFKDAAGNVYKARLAPQNVTNVPLTGPYCEFGSCPDGS